MPSKELVHTDVRRAHIGGAIRVERLRRSLSGRAVAASAGISRNWLSKIERGTVTPSIDVVQRVAGALGVSAAQLLDEGPGMPPASPALTNRAPVIGRMWDAQVGEPIRIVRGNARRAIRLP